MRNRIGRDTQRWCTLSALHAGEGWLSRSAYQLTTYSARALRIASEQMSSPIAVLPRTADERWQRRTHTQYRTIFLDAGTRAFRDVLRTSPDSALNTQLVTALGASSLRVCLLDEVTIDKELVHAWPSSGDLDGLTRVGAGIVLAWLGSASPALMMRALFLFPRVVAQSWLPAADHFNHASTRDIARLALRAH